MISALQAIFFRSTILVIAKRYTWLFISAGLSACYSPGNQFHETLDGHSETGKPALHAVQDQQLRELMAKMDALMQERYMTETEKDTQRRQYARRIAANAEQLSHTAGNIAAMMPSLTLTGDEQHTFLALARKLAEQSKQLQQQALQNQIDAVVADIRQINTTCAACHSLFRKLGG